MALGTRVYGASINGDAGVTKPKQCNMSCPAIGSKGLNFWRHACLMRIGNKDMKSCYRGCKEAMKYPELRAKIEKVLAEQEASNKFDVNILKEARSDLSLPVYPVKTKLDKKSRAKIIDMYKKKGTISDTCVVLKCDKKIVSFYRGLYRAGAMDREGNFAKEE